MDNEKRYKVLIVDDEIDNLQLLYRTLRRDYDVTKAQNPLEALEILKNDTFQCILSDHKMPDMDGVEFLKRSSEICPDTIRLLVTAYSDVEILMNAINYAKIQKILIRSGVQDVLLFIRQKLLPQWIFQNPKKLQLSLPHYYMISE